MARTRVQPLPARRWAGLLAVLALVLCTTALAQPAMAGPTDAMLMDAMPMDTVPMTPTMPWNATDRADAQGTAELSCPMDGMDDMATDCRPSAQHRPSSAPLPPVAHTPSTIADDVAESASARRAPPSPASREGPDLDRLCVSRT